jgi:hypothetical protein
MIGLDCCDASKFQAAGYGKYRPVSDNDSEDNRKSNRRVEIVFIRNDIDFSDPSVMQDIINLEFGNNFVSYTDSEGTTSEPISVETAAETDEAPRSDPDREYVSKSDVINDLPHDIPGLNDDSGD